MWAPETHRPIARFLSRGAAGALQFQLESSPCVQQQPDHGDLNLARSGPSVRSAWERQTQDSNSALFNNIEGCSSGAVTAGVDTGAQNKDFANLVV